MVYQISKGEALYKMGIESVTSLFTSLFTSVWRINHTSNITFTASISIYHLVVCQRANITVGKRFTV